MKDYADGFYWVEDIDGQGARQVASYRRGWWEFAGHLDTCPTTELADFGFVVLGPVAPYADDAPGPVPAPDPAPSTLHVHVVSVLFERRKSLSSVDHVLVHGVGRDCTRAEALRTVKEHAKAQPSLTGFVPVQHLVTETDILC